MNKININQGLYRYYQGKRFMLIIRKMNYYNETLFIDYRDERKPRPVMKNKLNSDCDNEQYYPLVSLYAKF